MRRMLIALVCVVAAFLPADAQGPIRLRVVSQLIPASRLTDWTPHTYTGVPGGIPTTRTNCVTAQCVTLTGAAAGYMDGTLDARTIIQDAITSALADTIVKLPCSGGTDTWRISGQITISATDDSVTLRGCGPGASIIECDFSGSYCLYAGSEADFLWSSPAAPASTITNYANGCADITVDDGSSYATSNQLLRFSVANDPTVPVISTQGLPDMRKQMTRLVSKSGNVLTVFPPIYHCEIFTGLAARVNKASAQGDFIGIEDLTVEDTGGADTTIQVRQTYGSWVKNVEAEGADNYLISVIDSLMPEVRHSNFHDGGTGGSNGAGIRTHSTSGCLIEDNIILEVLPLMEINNASSGCAFTYNFGRNADGADFGFDTNHGPQNSFNIYEGNIVHWINSDGYFGGEVNGTHIRNYYHANAETGFGTIAPGCFSLKRLTRAASLIGNVMGGSLLVADCYGNYGDPNIGNSTSTGTAQLSAGDSWQDWVPVSGTTPYLGTLTTRTDATHGVITLDPGVPTIVNTPTNNLSELWTASGNVGGDITIVSQVGDQLTITIANGTLPALSTAVSLWTGPLGFQEKDLDVAAQLIAKANWNVRTGVLDGSPLGTALMPPSLVYGARPSWFQSSLNWPPINYLSPSTSRAAIPAGYRYLNGGADPP